MPTFTNFRNDEPILTVYIQYVRTNKESPCVQQNWTLAAKYYLQINSCSIGAAPKKILCFKKHDNYHISKRVDKSDNSGKIFNKEYCYNVRIVFIYEIVTFFRVTVFSKSRHRKMYLNILYK